LFISGVRMRLAYLLLIALMWTADARARVLDLPVVDPVLGVIEGPSYRADALEIRLSAAASRAAAIVVRSARLAMPTGAAPARLRALGVPAVDRVAADLGGVDFEPMFRGEFPPATGSDAPDLAAFFRVRLPAAVPLDEALERFAALTEVEAASPIAVLPVTMAPNDSLWSEAYWLHQASRADIHALEAWVVSRGDPEVVIAILDTGVLPYHPDLGGTLPGSAGHMWVNARERDGVAGVDDDGNGFVDDVYGWDFVHGVAGSAGEDVNHQDPDPNDFAGHGTFVAGLAGAIPDNGIGLPGAAWNVRLMPVRMGWATNANPLGLVDMSFAAQAIHYAWRSGAHVINASWASLLTSGLDAAANAALRAGVTIVSAAGNNGQPTELASFDDVIAVAATDAFDRLAPFSNRGPWVDLSAPGANMSGTFIARTGSDSLGQRTPAYTSGLNGTSFAAPLVSAGAALVHAHRRALGMKPITPTGMRLRMRETSDDISLENPAGGFGAGRLRLDRALLDGPRSQALRMGAAMVGSPVVLATHTGGVRIVTAHMNQRLVMLDGQDGDTSWVVTTPGTPIGHVAAADFGAGRGVGLFVSTGSGLTARIAGYGIDGAPLPGWPVLVPGTLVQPAIALGDVTGDGVPDIVATAGDQVVAYGLDGAVLPGFPVELFPTVLPVALADLDGEPGLEIVAAAGSFLYVVNGRGVVADHWPVEVQLTQPPVVGRIRPFALPTILGVAGSELHAFAPNGTTRWLPRPMGAAATAAPALGDLDGDGSPEVLVATAAPALAAFDSLGQPLVSQGWPLALPSAASGHPLIGPLAAGGAPGVLAFRGGALYAFDRDAVALPGWPRLGAAGAAATLAEIDGDGRSEVLAGTDVRSLFYIHDAGADTWGAAGGWTTARGNFARTGATGPNPALVVPAPEPPVPTPGLALAPRANPSRLPVEFRWRSEGAGVQRIEILDLNGRRLRTLPIGNGIEGVASWDGRTASGDAVRAGL
jgi:subtilisin family serine protease